MNSTNEQLSNVLQKTCQLIPEAKKVSSRRYIDLLHHPTSLRATPGGGTILESEHEDDESEVSQNVNLNNDKKTNSSFPSLHLSLSGGTLQQSSTHSKNQSNLPDAQNQSNNNNNNNNNEDEGSFAPPSISPTPSLSSSIYTQGTHPSHTLQSILFGENLEGSQKNQSVTGEDIASLSLYDLSQSISSSTSQQNVSQVSGEKKKKKSHTTSSSVPISDKKETKDKSIDGKKSKEDKELESLLGVSLSSLNSASSDKMGITVVGPIESQNSGVKKYSTESSSSGAKKYWWDHLVDADVNTDAEGGDMQLESDSIINLGVDGYDSQIAPGGDDNVYDDEIIEDEEQRKFERYEEEN
eukprot:CAMPEP_0174818874 /NCGR_PEP_ID=MMETSP1107-20130205/1795_1 /TAXON_ID=36770 /ORGANISM="Paraphysomonas vestita, Strain GFlagA" /LENGTH=353 /DNA_ID=CAMNT_0016031409 /DNA_START=330 /DNA_END=1388 /DNA_ORIENTATION=+